MNLKFLFEKENRTTSILSIVYAVVGLLFCILPNFMRDKFETIFCILLLAYGSVMMFSFCVSSVVFKNKIIMITATLSIVFGLLLLFVRSFFVLALGLCILILAIFKVMVLKSVANSKNLIWYVWLALTIIYFIVIATVIVFFAINKYLNISMVLIGVCLIFEAAGNIFAFLRNQYIQEKLIKQ